jgi:NHLM bacteriocin system ABC transporter ATP-binding protein
MENIFKNEGNPVEAVGNKPLFLSGDDGVWLVHSGKVDVFAVPVGNGRPPGGRTCLFGCEPGQALFGMDRDKRKTVQLLAVGAPGTILLRLGLSRFLELAKDRANTGPVERLIHLWVTGLSVGVRKALLPKVFTELRTGAETTLENGHYARPSSGTVWVKHRRGGSYFMQRRDLPLINGDTTGFFPVSSQAWIEATEKTQLQIMDTSGCILEDPSLSDLERFHQFMVDCIALNITEADAEERQRLKVKEANDRAAFENALSRLGSILNPSGPAPVAGEGDALFTACRMIGEKMGIAFRQPVREAMAGRDPLDAIARFSRVRSRQVLLKGEWHRNDHGPLLAFAGEGRKPVALLPAAPGSYVLHDPSDRSRTKVTAEVAASLAPFACTFYRPFPDRALKGWDLFKFGLSGSLPDMWLILSVATCGAVLGLITPIATGIIINTVLPNAARSTLGQIALILITCAVASAMFDVTRAVALLRIESKMDASMQSGVMDRLLSLPVPFFRNFSAGDLAERTLGINYMRQIVSGVTTTAILAGVFSAFNFFLLFYYDQKLALVATLVIAVGIGFSSALSYLNVRHQRKLSGVQGKISGLVLQFITGISKIRLSGTEDRVFAVWAGEFAVQKRIAAQSRIIQGVQTTFNSSFPLLAAMALFAWIALGSETFMSAGAFSAFHSAYISFQNAMLQMFAALMAALTIVPLLERAKPILQTMPESDVNKASPGILSGDIEVSHVDFRYSSNGPLVLNDVSLHVRPGEFVALVGSSGSGKSTLLRLLLGFELPEAGAIYYDDQDLAALDVREVRRQMGVVLQSGKVMAGDIFKNIVGSSNLTPDNAWEAARMAGFEDDIKEMPMGMNTVMPPGGGTLSGGQRQRLLIARAVVHKPRILYFDEATSALDNRTQEIVSRSLEKLQSTRIVIAHRLSTIVHADRIFVLDKGRIVQSGTYEQLIRQEGHFADLANRQIA